MTYEDWLRAEGYAASTIRVSLAGYRQLERGDSTEALRSHAHRVLLAVDGGAAVPADLVAHAQAVAASKGRASPRRTRAKAQRQTARRALPLTSEEQRALWEALSEPFDGSQAARCAVTLRVMAETALRAYDTTSIRWSAVVEALDKGEERLRLVTKGGEERVMPLDAAESWSDLFARWNGHGETVGDWISPGAMTARNAGGAAYAALRKTLTDRARAAGIQRRVHPHLLRRTGIVEALLATGGSIERARDFAGHRLTKTTAGYLRDTRPEDVAEVQRAIARRRKGDD